MLFRNHLKTVAALILTTGDQLSLPPGDTTRDDLTIADLADNSQNSGFINSGVVELLNNDGSALGEPGFPASGDAVPDFYSSLFKFQRARLEKILWVTNDSYKTLGDSAIDAYAAAWGIQDTSHRLSFPFGSTDGTAINQTTFTTTVSNYVRDNDIDIVLLSLGCPVSFQGAGGDLLSFVANCGKLRSVVGGGGHSPLGTSSREVPLKTSWHDTAMVPCGRLGRPIVEALGSESISELVTMAQKSVAVGKTDNTDKRFLFGFCSRGGVEALTNRNHKNAWQVAVDYGFKNRANYVNTDTALQVSGMPSFVRPAQVAEQVPNSWASIKAGTTTPKLSYFLHWDVSNINFDGSPGNYTPTMANSLQPDPDYGVTFSWTSFGFQTGRRQLQLGACAMIGSYCEPYAFNLPAMDALLALVLSGLRLCEAVCFAGVPADGSPEGFGMPHYGVYGDPLGAPFGFDGIKSTTGDQKYNAQALADAATAAATAPAVAAATAATQAASGAAVSSAQAASYAAQAASYNSNPTRSIQTFINEQPTPIEYNGLAANIFFVGGTSGYDSETGDPAQLVLDIQEAVSNTSPGGDKFFDISFLPFDENTSPSVQSSVQLFDSNSNYGFDFGNMITPPTGHSVWRIYMVGEDSQVRIIRIA